MTGDNLSSFKEDRVVRNKMNVSVHFLQGIDKKTSLLQGLAYLLNFRYLSCYGSTLDVKIESLKTQGPNNLP